MNGLSLSSVSFKAHLETARLQRRLSKLLSRNRALLVKALPTAGGYAFGDCLTQQLGPLWPTSEWPSKHNLAKHDLNKTAAMGAVGALVGTPVSVALYHMMDSVAPGTGMALVAAKFAADQVVGCVLWQAAYMCINQQYRETFVEFASAQWQQRQQRCTSAVVAPVGSAVAAC